MSDKLFEWDVLGRFWQIASQLVYASKMTHWAVENIAVDGSGAGLALLREQIYEVG